MTPEAWAKIADENLQRAIRAEDQARRLRDEVVAYHEPPCAFHRPNDKNPETRQSCRCCRAIEEFDKAIGVAR